MAFTQCRELGEIIQARALISLLGSGLLIGLVAVVSGLLLPACGLLSSISPSWADWCPENTRAAAEDRLPELLVVQASLEREIAARERELALLQCAAEADPPPPSAEPEVADNAGIDEEEWNARDVSLLEGCWDLDSVFQTTNRQTGVQSRYSVWRMCFDADGSGQEEMRAENGSTCSGRVIGAFDASGALIIDQPANTQCSDGGYIYRKQSRCTLNQQGAANCVVQQPEVGGRAVVEFRRAEGAE